MVATDNKVVVIYGKKNSITANLKFRMEKEIIRRGIDLDLVEITDPEEFIREGITKVPFIKAEGRNWVYNEQDDINLFVKKVIRETMSNTEKDFVKQVIVPVDFSDYSKNSFYQGFKMARNLGAALTIVHVYAPVVVPAEGVLYVDPDLQKDVLVRFNQFVDELEKSLTADDRSSVRIEREFRTGMVTNELQDLIREKPGSMLVLSTSGTGQKIKEILGSVSLWVVKHAECPILLLPPKTHDLRFDRILFASDHFGVYDDAIDAIRYYTSNANAYIDVVHVFEEGSEYMKKNSQLPHESTDKHIHEVILFDDDFPGSIQRYLGTQKTDLLVMERKERGFWKELFHTSMTRKMAVYSEIPMLVLHEKQIRLFSSK
ncbi:MAG: universal stress protein [Saprospiraceae bacterium]|nr:universal stress protein [Saprospiraceae bacterium]